MEAWEVAAREQIRDVIARYNHAGDRGRSAELAACFTADGVLDTGHDGGRWEGAARIAAEIDAVAARTATAGGAPTSVRHHVSSVVIDLASATEATAQAYFLVLTAIGVDHWGRYRDRFRCVDGTWLIAERAVRVDGHAPGSLMVGG